MKQNKRIISLLLALCMVAMLLPVMTMAAEDTTEVIGVENIADKQYVYYGENKWLILDADADNTGIAGMFLLSADVVESGIQFDASGLNNAWASSDAKAWTASYATETFTDTELTAIKSVTKTDDLSAEQVIFLSAEEVRAYLGADGSEYMAAGNGWWLRTGHTVEGAAIYAGVVSDIGFVGNPHVAAKYDARPAMNLDTAKIAMFKSVEDGYKVSLMDESVSFTASCMVADQKKDYSDWNIDVTYSGAITGENAYVSVAIFDADGNTVHYANVANNSESGTASVAIPEGLLGNYTLKVFSEVCNGGTKTDYASNSVEIPLFVDDAMGDIESWNLSLGDDLDLNFHVKVNASVAADAYMNITVGSGSPDSYKVSEAQMDDAGNYIFTANVAAAQMTDTITLQLSVGEELGAVHTYSVQQYANAILADKAQEAYHGLVKEMLNYGGKAQIYFGYNTDNMADKDITVEAAAVPTETETKVTVKGSVDGIRYYGATLVFESKTSVRYYFNVSGDINEYTFTVAGDSLKPVQKNGLWYVEVSGINPQSLDQEYVIEVSNGTDVLSVNYSPLHYIVRMYNGNSTENLKSLLQAMYGYHEAAKSFVA